MLHADRPLPVTTSQALAQLVAVPLQGTSVSSLLQAAADLIKQLLPGDVEASLTLLGRHRATTAAFTGPLAADLDAVQYSTGQGPCLHAATSGELTEITDTRTDSRWAGFTRHAAGRGTLSSLSLPLAGASNVTGSLNIYAPQAGAFDENARSTGTRLALHAATALGNVRHYQAVQARIASLQEALDSREVIDIAAGMIMERQDVAATDAHRILTEVADQTGATVTAIAVRLVTTGQLPELDPH